MASSRTLSFVLFFCCSIFLLAPSTSSSSSSFISNEALETHSLHGRYLLDQDYIPCPVNFENDNFTIITSQCKGPNYEAKPCCEGFKAMGCPHAADLNDMKTDCAFALFDLINFHGHYPLGLFFDLCKENEKGLDCRSYKTLQQKNVQIKGKIHKH